MLTLRQLFEKHGYSTEFKFKTQKKFLVPLNHLEITSWGPLGDGIFPKHNACLCVDCIRSTTGYFHDYLQRNNDGDVIDGFTYHDVLNLEVNVNNFYIDAFPADFKTSPKLNEKQITEMFYNRIMNANENTVVIEDFNAQCKTYDEEREIIFTHSIFDKVFENDLMLLNKLKSWGAFDISKNLYKESQDTIDRFFVGFEQYLENDKNLFASNVENLFASYKVDLGKELKKQVDVEKDENYVIIDTIKFLVDFNTFRIATLDKVRNKWCQTYIESKFKYIIYMFLETDVKIKVKECDSSYILIFLNNENFEIVLNEWINNFDINCLTYDNKSDGESYTDDDGIVDNEFWVDNDLIQTARNLNNKIKELANYDDKKICYLFTPENENFDIVNINPTIENLYGLLNCNEETLLFKQFEIRNENEGKIYTIAYNNDAKDFNICATEYFTKLKMHLCSCNRRNLKYVLRHKIFRGNFIIYTEKVDRNSILQEEDEVNYDYKPKFIDMDLTIDEYIKEFNDHFDKDKVYDAIW